MGRPAKRVVGLNLPAPFEPTKEDRLTVRIMTACGMPQASIVQQIINPETGRAIDLKTLRRAFRKELDDGLETANAMVAKSLFQKAIGNGPQSVSAAIFWLKSKAQWRAVDSVEMTGKDGQPIQNAQSQVVVYLPDNGRDVDLPETASNDKRKAVRH